jgi:type VI secretion system secreted protein VgrG
MSGAGSEVTRPVEPAAGSDGRAALPHVEYRFTAEDTETSWRVRRLDFREGLSELYECVIELATEDLDALIEDLDGASCALWMDRPPLTRKVCGVVARVEWLGTNDDRLVARVHVRPALAALGQNRDSRMFQRTSVKDILQQVLSDGLRPYRRSVRFQLDREYDPREYCVQYAESDLDFALRLMAEEGMFFLFDQSGEHEELVVVDNNPACPRYRSADGHPVSVVPPEAPHHLIAVETVERLAIGRQMRSTGAVVRDYDWTRPALDLTFATGGPDARNVHRGVYEYPTPHVEGPHPGNGGVLRARLRREELHAGTRFAVGESNVTGLSAGLVLETESQQLAQLGASHLVTRVEHRGEALEDAEYRVAPEQAHRYHNRFTCASFDLPYRPPPRPRPVIPGAQTAVVVGPPGEEIHTDEHGRIKVQFHWDRQGRRDDHSSCWLRVMQTWAGAGFGTVFVPRIGMEVVVQFLDGNPDRPLAVGCVYNGANATGVGLPQDKTKSSLITRSSPGGSGYNELSFEDAAGEEVISVHAQKDMQVQILNDRTSTIGHDETASVSNDQQLSVGNDQTRSVGNNRTSSVGSNDSTTVGSNSSLSVGAAQTIQVGADRTATVGSNDSTTVGSNSSLLVGAAQIIQVGANRAATIGGSDSVTVASNAVLAVGSHQSIQVGSAKSEKVGGLSSETVGGAKTLSVGGALAVTVGAAMNTMVGGACLEEVGLIKIVKVGMKLELSCGSSKIVLEKGGKITIEGTNLNFTSKGGPVTVTGDVIDLN